MDGGVVILMIERLLLLPETDTKNALVSTKSGSSLTLALLQLGYDRSVLDELGSAVCSGDRVCVCVCLRALRDRIFDDIRSGALPPPQPRRRVRRSEMFEFVDP
jgi:hypothetical protein